MRKSKFSETQIVGILKDAEAGVALNDLPWSTETSPSRLRVELFPRLSPLTNCCQHSLSGRLNLGRILKSVLPVLRVAILSLRGTMAKLDDLLPSKLVQKPQRLEERFR